jgi:hypothetical protein
VKTLMAGGSVIFTGLTARQAAQVQSFAARNGFSSSQGSSQRSQADGITSSAIKAIGVLNIAAASSRNNLMYTDLNGSQQEVLMGDFNTRGEFIISVNPTEGQIERAKKTADLLDLYSPIIRDYAPEDYKSGAEQTIAYAPTKDFKTVPIIGSKRRQIDTVAELESIFPSRNGQRDFSNGPLVRFIKFGRGAFSNSLSDNEKLFVALHEFGHGRDSKSNWANYIADTANNTNKLSTENALTEIDASAQAFFILKAMGFSRDDAAKIKDVGYSRTHLNKAINIVYGPK